MHYILTLNGLQRLANNNLSRIDWIVLCSLLASASPSTEGIVSISQNILADKLNTHQSCISRAISHLLRKGVLISLGKAGMRMNDMYMLNENIGECIND